MEYIPVESSNIEALAYDSGLNTLFVRFLNGSEYSFVGVPKELYEKMLEDKSKGKFLNAFIRGKYPSSKVEKLQEETQDGETTDIHQ